MLKLSEVVVVGDDGTYINNSFEIVLVAVIADGKKRTLEITEAGLRWICPACEGTGESENEDGDCATCGGFGIDQTMGLEAIQSLMVIAQVV